MNITNIRKLNTDILFHLERLVETTENKLPWLNELISLRNKVENEMNLNFAQERIMQFIESISEYVIKHKRERKAAHEIRDYLDQNFTRKQSLQKLSDTYFLSKEHISKIFKEEFGMNLFEYITELKIEKAKLMLSANQAKVREIAEELGFNDESHFSKTFKKYTGLSPRAYREHLH
jgi:two-component system response regulator YesN